MIQKDNKTAFQLSFIVTHKCNLNCVYCYEKNRSAESMDVEFVKQTIAKYLNDESVGDVMIDFFGGEPWIEFEKIREVCEWVWSQKWRNNHLFFTTTNGTLIHGEVKEWLSQHREKFWCGLSLDGTRDTHNKNRSNSFDKIDVDFFRECWPEQTVKMTVSTASLSTLADDILYIQQKGFKVAGTNFAEGFDWGNEKFAIELCAQLEKLVDYYMHNPEAPVAPILDMSIENCEALPRKEKWCGTGGNRMIFYDTDKKHYPCNFFTPMTFTQEQLNNLDSVDFEDSKLFLDEYCYNNCYLYNVCPNCYGANYLMSGKLNCRDKGICNLVKIRAYYTAALKAFQILNYPEQFATNKAKTALQIKAIEKIRQMCPPQVRIDDKDINEATYTP